MRGSELNWTHRIEDGGEQVWNSSVTEVGNLGACELEKRETEDRKEGIEQIEWGEVKVQEGGGKGGGGRRRGTEWTGLDRQCWRERQVPRLNTRSAKGRE